MLGANGNRADSVMAQAGLTVRGHPEQIRKWNIVNRQFSFDGAGD